MPEIRADRRCIHYEADPEALAAAGRLCRKIQEDQIALAILLERIHRKAAFIGEKCTSIGEFTLRHGLTAKQGHSLRLVGHAMTAFEWVEARLRDGSLALDQAEEVGRLTDLEGTIEEGDDWETWARFLPVRELRAKVRRRLEEVKQASKTLLAFSTHLTQEAMNDYTRARILASRKAKQALTRGQTVAVVMRHYVERHDAQEKKPAKRRIGDTSAKACRTIPAEVRRACLGTYGDRCWVPGCQHEIFVETMHREAKEDGGGQEIDNVDLGCHTHHVLYDAGRMWIVGENERGLPIFETDDGWILHPDFPGRPLRKSAEQPDSEPASKTTEAERSRTRRARPGPASRRATPPDRVGEPTLTFNGVRAAKAPWGGASLSGETCRLVVHVLPRRRPTRSRSPPG